MLNFATIDFETANPKRASVCQIGMALVENSVITRHTMTMVRPPAGYDEFSIYQTRVHGLTARDVEGAPTWDLVLPVMLDLTRGLPLVAHNASFERSVIEQASFVVGTPAPEMDLFCSVKLSKRINPEFSKHKLNLLMQEFGMKAENHHDAGADAVMNAQIVLAMAKKAGVDSFEELFDIPWKVARRGYNTYS